MINVDISRVLIQGGISEAHKDIIDKAEKILAGGNEPLTGWVDLPLNYSRDKHSAAQLKSIVKTAEKIRQQCEVFVVVGIGGSYMGARAAIEMLALARDHSQCDNAPKIYYAGNNLSGTYYKELIEEITDKSIAICMISKSGATVEPNIAFAILKELLIEKYGENEACNRIYAITDPSNGPLREEVEKKGYANFEIPDNIPGRYSVLTPVGLLPMAVAGIDVEAIIEGAALEHSNNKAEVYASARFSLIQKGKLIEIFENYEPKLHYFVEWIKQLFGESEGKDGKGLFPAALQFSTDLHSMGQFLQDGNQIFFETVINVENPPKDIKIPESVGDALGGKSVNYANKAAMLGVIEAHSKTGIPIIKIDIPELTPFVFGQMVYFFEKSCALTCYLMGVNPFDQPGVESYKAEMRKKL